VAGDTNRYWLRLWAGWFFAGVGLLCFIAGTVLIFAMEAGVLAKFEADRAALSSATTPGESWIGRLALHGDYFGGTFGAVANVAGTFLFFAALLLQGYEIAQSREEQITTNRIHDEQKSIFDEQTRHLKEQSAIAKSQVAVERILAIAPLKKTAIDRVTERPSPNALPTVEKWRSLARRLLDIGPKNFTPATDHRHGEALEDSRMALREIAYILALDASQRAILGAGDVDMDVIIHMACMVNLDERLIAEFRETESIIHAFFQDAKLTVL